MLHFMVALVFKQKRIPTVLPPFSAKEALKTTKIHSVAGKIDHETSLMTSSPRYIISDDMV